MSGFLSVLVIIACVLLVLVIIIQNPKGGGLAAEFSSSSQFMGVRKTADFLEKATWTLAIALVFLSFISTSTVIKPGESAGQESEIQELIENMPEPVQNVPSMSPNIPMPKNQ